MKLTNKILGLGLAVAVGFASSAMADDSGVAKKKSLEQRIAELEAKLKDAGVGGGVKGSGIRVSGYVDTSYLANIGTDRDGAAGGGAKPAGASYQNTGRVFDYQYDSFNVNAVKLTIEKSKDSSRFPAGFRVDTIYGDDARTLNGANAGNAAGITGTGDSTLFLEQAYVDLGVPIGNGVDVKFGKMVSLVGYEVIESPANWQFSRSDAFRLAPKTQTGVTAGYQWNDYLTSTVGLINGFDSETAAATTAANTGGGGNLNTDLSFVGRVDASSPKWSVGEFNGFVAGYYGAENIITPADNSANTSIVNIGGTWAKPFEVKKLTLGIDWLERVDSGITTGAALAQSSSASADAVSAYGAWVWTKYLTTSGRFSHTWYDQSTAAGLGAQGLSPFAGQWTGAAMSAPRSYTVSSFTLTQAFNIWKDTLVRLEWRHDWTDLNATANPTGGAAGGAGFGTTGGTTDARDTQDTIGVNVVYSF